MICSNCKNSIDDKSVYCTICGAPVDIMPRSAPRISQNFGTPQPTQAQVTPQEQYPQQEIYTQQPQQAPYAPQASYPQQAQYPPQATPGGSVINIAPVMAALFSRIIWTLLMICAFLVIVGTVGLFITLVTTSGGLESLDSVRAAIAFTNLARIPAIISFVAAIGGVVFSFLTGQKPAAAIVGFVFATILFIFNFFIAPLSSIKSMLNSLFDLNPGTVFFGMIVLFIFGIALSVCSSVAISKIRKNLRASHTNY